MSQIIMSEELDNRDEFNYFYLDLKNVLEKHNVRIVTNPHNDDSFF